MPSPDPAARRGARRRRPRTPRRRGTPTSPTAATCTTCSWPCTRRQRNVVEILSDANGRSRSRISTNVRGPERSSENRGHRDLLDPPLRKELLVRGRPVVGAERTPRRGERPVVARRDDVQRPALQERLDDLLLLERARQLRVLEAVDARVQRQVRRRRVLRLQPTEQLDDLRNAGRLPLEEALARQERAVQLDACENPLGHAGNPASLLVLDSPFVPERRSGRPRRPLH